MKKLACLLLAALMLLGLVACGETPPAETTPPAATNAPATTDAPTPDPSEPIKDIVLVSLVINASTGDQAEVIEEINKIARAKTGTQMTFLSLTMSAYYEQMNLMLASGEKLDIVQTGLAAGIYDYTNQVNKGLILPLNDLVAEHGQAIAEALGEEYLHAASTVDGQYYAVTQRRDLATAASVQFVKEFMDKHNIDITGYTEYLEMGPLFQQAIDADPNIIGALAGDGGNLGGETYISNLIDTLGDDFGMFLDNKDEGMEITTWWEDPEFTAAIKVIRDWYTSGYTLQDVGTNTITAKEMIQSSRLFAMPGGLKAGEAGQTLRSTGKEVEVVQVSPFFARTYSVCSFLWGIAYQSEDPVAAMKFLNLMYEDADVVNLFIYGIEGKHWQFLPDGRVTYADGVNNDNIRYRLNINWVWGDTFKMHVWETDDIDVWEQMDRDNREGVKSKALGFVFDTEPVKNDVASIANVIQEYKRSLLNGMIDPETAVPEMMTKLRAAGFDDVLAEKQSQLNTWYAAQS
ncbi:ABC transporter substrate-binding protein [Oscillospiraceae bacterium OttesenSCG-928-F05]|nr:ABC transporter substrate-binding protein [Oscillospiraceae bacterium OttesenSCG-928-F05]